MSQSPSWAEWMCPVLEPHQLLELERGRRQLQELPPAQVLEMATQLWRLTVQYDAIVRGATKRIAELELQELLSGYESR